jgi:chitin synthase
MDDFSWGQTRKVIGEKASGQHGDKEGEFDSSHIVMKRWAEFERDRRWKANAQHRESTYDVVYRSNSPGRPQSTRQSIISSAETYHSHPQGSERLIIRDSSAPSLPQMGYVPPGMYDAETASSYHAGPRHSVPVLEVPAPLAPQTHGTPPLSQAASFADTGHRSEPAPYDSPNPFGDDGGAETLSSPQLPGIVSQYRGYRREEAGDDEERQAMLPSGRSPPLSPGTPNQGASAGFGRAYSDEPDALGGSSSEGGADATSSRGRPTSVVGELQGPPAGRRQSRGVSLIDVGPVAGAGGEVRVVQRSRRQSSTANHGARRSDVTAAIAGGPSSQPSSPLIAASPFSTPPPPRFNPQPSLPPGAAPPRSQPPP